MIDCMMSRDVDVSPARRVQRQLPIKLRCLLLDLVCLSVSDVVEDKVLVSRTKIKKVLVLRQKVLELSTLLHQ